ncbi:MAG: enoyl-CoA hydratase/isomerase family protein, partial [Deltaproteobacteria bacterium]|nr:enoyl-CoA hydratase/isomerase family protein [Deltaproteobacteria bacterium]
MSEQKFSHLNLKIEDGLAELSLNRPKLHNAFNEKMIAELNSVFSALGQDPSVRVIFLKGEGPSFCAGADLHWMKSMASYSFEENLADAKKLHEMLLSIQQCPKPVVAWVHGAVMGGGLGLVAACDMAYAVEDTQFAFTEVHLGLIPAVISPFVLRKMGEGALRELFLTGERFSAKRAYELGLIQVFASSQDLEKILALKLKL